jgi:predicted porin
MNKKISAAVASAALVLGASSANAGIIIPAGEWTVDINGNVNAYATVYNFDDTAAAAGGLSGAQDGLEDSSQSINTGLLPAWLGFTATTRQNDLDVSWTISMQPNVSDNDGGAGDNTSAKWRQAFLTFGDKSWGSVKMGKDLGIFAGNAILNDMTLLGVGGNAGSTGGATSGAKTSLGGIGTGYVYPSWVGQIAYTTPNFNGLTATVAITNPNHSNTSGDTTYQDRFGLEGQVQYAFDSGKVWSSVYSYKERASNAAGANEWDSEAIDVGAALNFGNLGLVAYYYSSKGLGSTFRGGLTGTANTDAGIDTNGNERDGDGGYVQATYVIPSGTKLGVAYGVSTLDKAGADDTSGLDENKRWTIGAYHPLTKHLNLVAEYNVVESDDHAGVTSEGDALSVGAILFF